MTETFVQASFALTCSIDGAVLIEEAWEHSADLSKGFEPGAVSAEPLVVFPPKADADPFSGFTSIFDHTVFPKFDAGLHDDRTSGAAGVVLSASSALTYSQSLLARSSSGVAGYPSSTGPSVLSGASTAQHHASTVSAGKNAPLLTIRSCTASLRKASRGTSKKSNRWGKQIPGAAIPLIRSRTERARSPMTILSRGISTGSNVEVADWRG